MEQDIKITNLVVRAKQGDENAFADLYNTTYKMVYHTCLGHLRNTEETEDAVQDVYISAFKSLPNLQDPNTFYGWLKTIAVHTCLNIINAKKRHGNISYDDAIQNEEFIEGDDNLETLPDTYIMRAEKRKIVLDILSQQLSDVQYQTVFMYYYDNLSIEQIAKLTNCSDNTVKSRLRVARAKIKAGIEDYENKTGDRLAGAACTLPFLSTLFNTQLSSIPMRFIPYGVGRAAMEMSKLFRAGHVQPGTGMGAHANANLNPNMGAHANGNLNPQAMSQPASPYGNSPVTQVKTAAQDAGNAARNAARPARNSAAEAATSTASKGVVTKVIASVAALAVLGGGIATVATIMNKDKKSEPKDNGRSGNKIDVSTDETTAAPTEPEEPEFLGVDWGAIYMDAINSGELLTLAKNQYYFGTETYFNSDNDLSLFNYNLIYINDDDIPELVIEYDVNTDMYGKTTFVDAVFTIIDDKVEIVRVGYYFESNVYSEYYYGHKQNVLSLVSDGLHNDTYTAVLWDVNFASGAGDLLSNTRDMSTPDSSLLNILDRTDAFSDYQADNSLFTYTNIMRILQDNI